MKISYDWLKDYTKVTLDSQRLAHKLTLAGLEVEKIEEATGIPFLNAEIKNNI